MTADKKYCFFQTQAGQDFHEFQHIEPRRARRLIQAKENDGLKQAEKLSCLRVRELVVIRARDSQLEKAIFLVLVVASLLTCPGCRFSR